MRVLRPQTKRTELNQSCETVTLGTVTINFCTKMQNAYCMHGLSYFLIIKVSGVPSGNKLIKTIRYPHMWRYHVWPISLQYFRALSNTCYLLSRRPSSAESFCFCFFKVKVKFSFIVKWRKGGLSRSQMRNWTNSSKDNKIQTQRRKLRTTSSCSTQAVFLRPAWVRNVK